MSDARWREQQPNLILSSDAGGVAGEGVIAALLGFESNIAGVAAPARGGLSGWQRNKLADFIEENIGETLRLAALADLVNLSPYHFARAFKRSFGLPPHRYHACRRVARAKRLLDDPARSITEIARALGFSETSSFSTAFRKATGVAPSRYRRRRG